MGVRGLLRLMRKMKVYWTIETIKKLKDFINCKDLFNTKKHKVCLPINPFDIENFINTLVLCLFVVYFILYKIFYLLCESWVKRNFHAQFKRGENMRVSTYPYHRSLPNRKMMYSG